MGVPTEQEGSSGRGVREEDIGGLREGRGFFGGEEREDRGAV